ncbi:MAG TPA: hypothetical protein VFQ45_02200 [Longimicrobium sp.]|nr:hypothetical protein [Longimicrobium sp.]
MSGLARLLLQVPLGLLALLSLAMIADDRLDPERRGRHGREPYLNLLLIAVADVFILAGDRLGAGAALLLAGVAVAAAVARFRGAGRNEPPRYDPLRRPPEP